METERFGQILENLIQIKTGWRECDDPERALFLDFLHDLISTCEDHYLKGVTRHDIMHILLEAAIQTANAIDDVDQVKTIVEFAHEVKCRGQEEADFISKHWPEGRSN